MESELAEALAKLNAYVPNGTNNYEFFYEFTDWIEALGNPVDAIEPIFLFIERYPEADMGAPGPLVHLLESYGAYQPLLVESLNRRPTSTTVLMVARILNSNLDDERRNFWLEVLANVQNHAQADDYSRKRATTFLQRFSVHSSTD